MVLVPTDTFWKGRHSNINYQENRMLDCNTRGTRAVSLITWSVRKEERTILCSRQRIIIINDYSGGQEGLLLLPSLSSSIWTDKADKVSRRSLKYACMLCIKVQRISTYKKEKMAWQEANLRSTISGKGLSSVGTWFWTWWVASRQDGETNMRIGKTRKKSIGMERSYLHNLNVNKSQHSFVCLKNLYITYRDL